MKMVDTSIVICVLSYIDQLTPRGVTMVERLKGKATEPLGFDLAVGPSLSLKSGMELSLTSD